MSVTKADLEALLKAYLDGLSTDIKTALREEQDIHSVFAWSKFLNQGIDAHFDCRKIVGGIVSGAKASDYWKQTTGRLGEINCPASLDVLAMYSKNVFNLLAMKTVLPSYLADGGFWFGFEDDSATGTGMVTFRFYRLGVNEYLRVYAGGQFSYSELDITAALPANAKTVAHTYGVAILKPWTEFYIDEIPRAFGINSPNLAFTAINYPPYAIFRANSAFSTQQLALLEITSAVTVPLSPHDFRLSHISELPPRVFRLYDAGTTTLFAGLTIAAGSETSHPVPTFGYQGKTINFRASEQGTLSLEVLKETNNWREYDTMGITQNKVKTYPIEDEAVLARVVYTPNTYPCTISEAEVVLR